MCGWRKICWICCGAINKCCTLVLKKLIASYSVDDVLLAPFRGLAKKRGRVEM